MNYIKTYLYERIDIILKYVTTGTIAVSCDTFATEYNADCMSADYLMVSDGNSELGTFCGKYYTSYNL